MNRIVERLYLRLISVGFVPISDAAKRKLPSNYLTTTRWYSKLEQIIDNDIDDVYNTENVDETNSALISYYLKSNEMYEIQISNIAYMGKPFTSYSVIDGHIFLELSVNNGQISMDRVGSGGNGYIIQRWSEIISNDALS